MLFFYLAAIEDPVQRDKFEYIYKTYFHFMYQAAYSVIRSSDLAEEAVHETFLQLIKEIDSLRINSDRELKSYLYILTRERSIDFLRRWERQKGAPPNRNFPNTDENMKEPELIVLTNMKLEKTLSILSSMPIIYRQALTLRVKGYSIKEISEMTKTSEATVKSRIHRARKLLLESFDE